MFGTHDLALFVVSGLLLNITPGPDSLYIVARSSSQGWRAGAAAALGIATGCYVHILAAALGLSALLATSAFAFSLLRWVGGAYLVYVGISMLHSIGRQNTASLASLAPISLRQVFFQGFLTNVLNPKVGLFFLAFVPQFIDPAAPSKALAFFFLGVIFNINGTLWCLFLAWSAAMLSQRMSFANRMAAWLNRVTGVLFVYLGFKLFFTREN